MKNKLIKQVFFLVYSLLLLEFSANCQSKEQGFRFTNTQIKQVKIPFTICNNLIVIDAIINDLDTLHLILDSGVENIIITDPSIGKKLNLTYSGKVNVRGAGSGSNIYAQIASGNKISLSGIIGNNLKLLVLSEDIFDLPSYLGKEVHGLIGYDLFSKFVIEISPLKKNLVFYQPNFFAAANGFTAVPIEILNSKPYIRVKVLNNDKNWVEINLLMDTGASHAISLNSDSILVLLPSKKSIINHLGVGFSGVIEGKTDIISAVQINKFVFNNVVVSFPNAGLSNSIKNFKIGGSIGGEIFRRFTIIFDYQNKTVFLKRNMLFKENFDYNKSGIVVIAKGKMLNKYVISIVNKNSVGEFANFLPEDEIIAINSIPCSQLNINQINAILSGKNGKKVDFIIQRNNELLTKSIILENLF